jgi:membrane protease YdiL (CAAX protease family)
MDRRLTVIIAICLLEAMFRSLPDTVPLTGLAFTLAARLIQIAVILAFAFGLCGIVPARPVREAAIGLGAACIFGVLVLLTDLAWRLVLDHGLLNLILARQHVTRPLLFFATACLVGPFAEELFFRGLLYSWMRPRIGAMASIIITSALFASMHGGISLVQFTGGLLFATLFEWRKTIWVPLVFHCLGNLAIWVVPHLYPLM